MPNFFYTDENGNKQGPLTPKQIQTLVGQGIVTPTTPLETDTGKQGLAGQIKGLFNVQPPNPFAPTPVSNQSAPQSVPVPVAENEKHKKPLLRYALAFILVLVGVLVLFGYNPLLDFGYSDSPSGTVKRFFRALEKIDGNTVSKTTTPDVFEELQSRRVITKHDKDGFLVPEAIYSLRKKIKSYSHTIDGDTAEVKVDFGKTLAPTVNLVKVDGKWIINDLAGLRALPSFSASGTSGTAPSRMISGAELVDNLNRGFAERHAQWEQDMIDKYHDGERPRSADSRICSVAFSPDGKKIVTTHIVNTVKIWDDKLDKHLQTLEGHTDQSNSAIFSPDGKMVVTASRDKTARIWDAELGKELHKLEGHTDWVLSAAFSPDGTKIVTASQDKTVRIWDAESGKELQKLEGHTSKVASATFSPDGKKIVTAGNTDRTVRIWEAESGKQLQTLEVGILACSASFSPDGKKIVAVVGSTVLCWDTESGRELLKLEADRFTIFNSATFSPDGTKIVTGGDGFRIWDATSGKELQRFNASNVFQVTFSPDGKKIVGVDSTHTVRFQNVE